MATRISICIGLIAVLFYACSKNKDGGPDDRNKGHHYGNGHIFSKEGLQGLKKLDLTNGELSDVIPYWSSAGWDISWDGTKGVKKVDVGDYATQYVIFSTKDGTTSKVIDYEPHGSRGGLPRLSPDGTKLALLPTFYDGLVVLTLDGTVICNVSGYGSSHEFEYLDPLTWEPAGTILFKKDGGLWRTTADFT